MKIKNISILTILCSVLLLASCSHDKTDHEAFNMDIETNSTINSENETSSAIDHEAENIQDTTETDIPRTHYMERDAYICLHSCMAASNNCLDDRELGYSCSYKGEYVQNDTVYYMYEGNWATVLVEKTEEHVGELGYGNIIVQYRGIEECRATFFEPPSHKVLCFEPLYVDLNGGAEELVIIYDNSSMNETCYYLYIYDIMNEEEISAFSQNSGGLCLYSWQEDALREALEEDIYFKSIMGDAEYYFERVIPMISNINTLCTSLTVTDIAGKGKLDTTGITKVNMTVLYDYNTELKRFEVLDFFYTVY